MIHIRGGERSTLIKSEIIAEKCPNCQNSFCVTMNIYQKYIHILWVPFIPNGKVCTSTCEKCLQSFSFLQTPFSFVPDFERLKRNSKTPLWHFTGLFLVVFAISGIVFYNKQNNQKIIDYIRHPHVNDVYELKINDTTYTLYRIVKVKNDTIDFSPAKYQSNQESDLSDLAEKGFDTHSVYPVVKSGLQKMNKKDEIIDIDRK